MTQVFAHKNKHLYITAILLLLLGLCTTQSLFAQFYNGSDVSFGRKRVQYESFFWMYYRFDGFDVYFNRKGKNLALYTAGYIQNHLSEMESKIGFSAQEELKFIVFNRLSDFKQSNIGYIDETSETGYNTGGVTRFIDNKVFLYFEGDYVRFERQIRRGIASILLSQAISGSKVSTQYKNSYLMDLPLWFTEGLAAYFSEPWNEEYDEKIQKSILRKDYKYFTGLEGGDGSFAGHSFWYFISKRYGADAVPRCIRIVASERKMEKTFKIALNVKFKDLMKEWYEFFSDSSNNINRDSAVHSMVLKRTNRPNRVYQQFTINPGAESWKNDTNADANDNADNTQQDTPISTKKHKGGELAFVENKIGLAKVFVQSIDPPRRRCIYKIGTALNDMPDYSFPVLSWHPNGHALGIITEEKGRTTLFVYDLEKKKKKEARRRYFLDYFEKITSFSFSEDGRTIVLSASSNGQSDIYIHHLGAGTDKQITFDLYDDNSPAFIPGTDLIVFSSNRPDDTIRKGEKFEIAPSLPMGQNLFSYDTKKGGISLFRLTNENDRIKLSYPKPLDNKSLLFLTNASGKTDIAAGRLGKVMDKIDTAIHYRSTFTSSTLTNAAPGLDFIDLSIEANAFSSLSMENGRFVLAVEPLDIIRNSIYPKLPKSVVVEPTPFKKELITKQKRVERRMAIMDSLMAAAYNDTSGVLMAELERAIAPQKLSLRCATTDDREELTAFDIYLSNRNVSQPPTPEIESNDDVLLQQLSQKQSQIPQQHQEQIQPQQQEEQQLLSSKKTKRKRRKNKEPDGFMLADSIGSLPISGDGSVLSGMASDSLSRQVSTDSIIEILPKVPPKQHIYRPQFSVNKAVSQLGFSFLSTTYQAFTNSSSPIYLNSSVNGLTQISLSDLMENHRIIGGFSFSFDFTTFEYLVSYEYLERRLGHQFVFHIINRNDNSLTVEPYKQNTYNAYYVMKYPISPVNMIKGTVFARYDRTVFKSYEWNSLIEPNLQQLKVGLKGEWIYDHARYITQNIYFGTRGKFFAEYYQGIVHDNQNLFVVGFDWRDYRRLHKNLIWANRIAASTSFGQQKLVYYMGGVDGWLLPRFNSDIKTDPSQNYAYQTLATNMRGFIQNIRNGNSFLVINSEIRFPFMQVLSKGPVKSSFLRHLQLVVFGDIGSAWSDWNPWSEDNQFYKKTVVDGKITIELQKDANPIVGGFGVGLRCQLLGYFIRGDLAWGVENGLVHNKPVFYFSLSTDF